VFFVHITQRKQQMDELSRKAKDCLQLRFIVTATGTLENTSTAMLFSLSWYEQDGNIR
jgi:hypothetical protein